MMRACLPMNPAHFAACDVTAGWIAGFPVGSRLHRIQAKLLRLDGRRGPAVA